MNETILDYSTDGILCENTSFGCSNNKKRKLEIDWSWKLIIQEIKTNKDDHTQYTWSLILQQFIQNNWTQVPKTYLLLMVEHVVRKLHEIETNDFQNRRNSNVQAKKIDLVSIFCHCQPPEQKKAKKKDSTKFMIEEKNKIKKTLVARGRH